MTIRRWSFLSIAARTITPRWTPTTCRRIWSRWSGFSGECWRIPGKPSSGRWKSKAKATSPWHSSRGSSPVEPCAAPCGRSGAKVEEVPAQGASGAVWGLCGPVSGSAVLPGAPGLQVSDFQAGEKAGVKTIPQPGSHRPATPVVSRDSGLSRAVCTMGSNCWIRPKNGVSSRQKPGISANKLGSPRRKGSGADIQAKI